MKIKNVFAKLLMASVLVGGNADLASAATAEKEKSDYSKPRKDFLNVVELPQQPAQLPAKELRSAQKLCRSWMGAAKNANHVSSGDLYVVVSTGEYSCKTLVEAVPGVIIRP